MLDDGTPRLGRGHKGNAIALVPLLLLTDYFWSGLSFRTAVRGNWRLYSVLGLGALPALAFVIRTLSQATSAGFAVSQFTWYQYFFTECRAIAEYIGLFLLPVGQTADHDFPCHRDQRGGIGRGTNEHMLVGELPAGHGLARINTHNARAVAFRPF